MKIIFNNDLVNLLIYLNNGYFCITHEHNNDMGENLSFSCSVTF